MPRLGSLLLLLSVVADARRDAPGCGTTPNIVAEQLFLHRQADRARRSRPAPLAPAIAPADRDIGNIAIIEDSGGVVEKLNQFNLDGSTLTFTATTPDASRYRYAISGQSYDAAAAAQGTPLIALDDDDARELALPFAFPFFGGTYRKVWVNSDGNLTFTAAENASSGRNTGRVTGGPPRIAALFDDLDPSKTAGGVRMFADASHAVFSWVAVPEYQSSGFGAKQTFQIKLYPDGSIVLAYAGVNPVSAVVGIAPGAARGATSLVSLKNDPSAEYSAAVVERFGNSIEIDVVLVAQRFFQTHEDAYDYLVIYNNAELVSCAGAIACEGTVRSSGSGWGVPVADNGRQYGSASRLRSTLNMGDLKQYPKDPNAVVPLRAASRDTPLTVIGHEAGHLFLAFASIPDPNNPTARPMLGYGGVHWSFVFNSEASLDEGEQIADRGTAVSPRFLTSAVTQGYSPLDQYLMGFRAPFDVPDTFVVTGYPSNVQPTFHPMQGFGFDGNRLNITVGDIIGAEGRRTPDYRVAQRRYRFAFLMVVPAGSQVPDADVQQVETYRQEFPAFFARASSGNAGADTTLNRSLKLSIFPAVGVIAGGAATATIDVQTAAATDRTVQLQVPRGFAQVPGTVRIPAGATSATFTLNGVRPGVEDLFATIDSTYETAVARVQVASAPEARLSAISTAPESITVQLSDTNELAYPGARIRADASAGGSVTPGVGVTDDRGRATFRWSPGPASSNQLRLAVEAAPDIALTLNAGAAVTSIGAVVNAASFVRGIVPGGLATLFGTNLAGGKLALNGVALPTLYASDTQINFYVPADTPIVDATVAVTAPGGAIATLVVTVSPVQPGIFAAVYRAGYLEIYCTGFGTSQAPTVFLGATPVQPIYSGVAPGYIGLNQVNVQVPPGISGATPLLISIGKAVSNEIKVTVP